MKTNQELIGKEAQLPNGQKVVVEEVENGTATVRRVEGDRRGTRAVCKVESLLTQSKRTSR